MSCEFDSICKLRRGYCNGDLPPCASKPEVAAHSTSDNASMDAIALCKEIIRLAGGAQILTYPESTKIINGARAVVAQQAHVS